MPFLEWRNSVHEDISYSYKDREDVKLISTDIVIHHLGNTSLKKVQKKNKRNLKYLWKDYNDGKAHSLTYFAIVNALMIEGGYENHKRCVVLVDECFEKFPPGKDDPLTPKMWMIRGLNCMACDQIAAAKQSLHTAWDDFQHPEGGVNLAECYMREENYNKAAKVLEQMYVVDEFKVANIPVDIRDIERLMLHKLGVCYDKMYENLNKAAPVLLKKLDNEDQEQNDKRKKRTREILVEYSKKAIKYYREYMSIEPYNLAVGDRLAHMLRLEGQDAEANFITVSMVNMFPSYAVGWSNLAQFEMQCKRYNTARIFLQEACRLDPRNRMIRHNLLNIKRALRAK